MEIDVLVIGSGAAGLATAVVAAHHGLRVLVVEKSNYYGGTTAYSLGAPWIIANKHQPPLQLEDSPEKGDEYLRQTLGDLYDADKVSAYIESGKDMVAFMEEKTEVRWDGIPMPDYFPDAQGAAFGRTMLTRAYDGRPLGKKYLNQIRPPLPGFSVFGDMQVDPREAGHLTNSLKNRQDFLYAAKKFLTYIKDKIVYGRGAYLANGNALIGALMKSALDSGVQLWRSAPATRLLTDNGAVVGAIVQREGVAVTITAKKGVVLASGGFGANPELRAKYIPLADSHISVQPDENTGDGIRIGQEAGGVLGAVNPENGVWAPVSIMINKDGSLSKYPHFGPDRGKPGSIIVDQSGKRFANEA
ncbi:MAG: FAD-dependent oxidoreductase, partial [Porticoccaceae bacterium]|nr:FAD-dependent oxidoreductase [Porticoccaceae bacterium]